MNFLKNKDFHYTSDRDKLPAYNILGVARCNVPFSDPPQARDGHVSFELSLLHGLMTVFVRTSDDFEKTSFQVSL